MKTRVASLTLLCLALAAIPAFAGELYNNGPINGDIDSFAINFGFIASNEFVLSAPSTVTGLSFGAWLFPGDTLNTAEVSITSQENGGTTYFDQVVSFSASDCFSNPFGFTVCKETGNFNTNLAAGTFWVNLQNAVIADGDPVYWDESNGPSEASSNGVGTIPSESFTILGSAGGGGGTTPEPGSILLFGSGILGVIGVLRRKLF